MGLIIYIGSAKCLFVKGKLTRGRFQTGPKWSTSSWRNWASSDDQTQGAKTFIVTSPPATHYQVPPPPPPCNLNLITIKRRQDLIWHLGGRLFPARGGSVSCFRLAHFTIVSVFWTNLKYWPPYLMTDLQFKSATARYFFPNSQENSSGSKNRLGCYAKFLE